MAVHLVVDGQQTNTTYKKSIRHLSSCLLGQAGSAPCCKHQYHYSLLNTTLSYLNPNVSSAKPACYGWVRPTSRVGDYVALLLYTWQRMQYYKAGSSLEVVCLLDRLPPSWNITDLQEVIVWSSGGEQ